MRVTDNMIMNKTKYNINLNKMFKSYEPVCR